MKIIVTGGAGFIGSHLSEALLKRGRQVAVIDDLNSFYSPSLKRANLAAISARGPFAFHQLDICDEAAVCGVFESVRPDAVVHLAARAGVRPSLEQPLLYEKVNVRGTMVLLEAARRYGVPRFVFASSSSVYGVANQVPFREDDFTMMPISPYAATKIAGEKLCYTYSHLYGIRTVCLRFFTVYGPRQRPDLAIRKFIDLISEGSTIPVFGDGLSGRDYTYIDDIVSGILAAIEYPCAYEIFNLGNSSPVKLTELIATVEHALGKRAVVRRLPNQPGDVPITYADIGKARRLLGYSPGVSFRDGIERMVAWRLSQPSPAAA